MPLQDPVSGPDATGSYFIPAMSNPGGLDSRNIDETYTFTIASASQFTSAGLNMDEFSFMSVVVSGTWTAGDLQIYVSDDDPDVSSPDTSLYFPLYDSGGTQVAFTLTANQTYGFVGDKASAIAASKFIVFRSSVEQEQLTTLKVVVKG